MSLSSKIDFALIISVKNANPNGDPLNGNRPRIDFDGKGEITDVCLKRKVRDRLMELGCDIFVQSDEKKIDSMTSLKNRAFSDEVGLGQDAFNPKKTSSEETIELACKRWMDVRTFGQIFALKGRGDSGSGISIPIRGPVTIHSAFSVDPINITSTQITRSVSGEGDGTKRGPDTMGRKHRVDDAIYVTYGAMSPQLAKRTGFSDQDAEKLKSVLPKLFEGDASAARPEGSMTVEKLIWWQHNSESGNCSSSKVHRSLRVNSDGSYELDRIDGLIPEEIDGF